MKGYLAQYDYNGTRGMFPLYPDLLARDGQTVAVLDRLEAFEVDEEEVGPMFRVRWPDGYEYTVFRDELTCLHGDEDAADCMVGGSDAS
jgi:hypothetical protein